MPLEVRKSVLIEPASEGSWKNLAVPSIQQSLVAVVLSEDNHLTQLVGSVIRSPWRLESCRYGDGLVGLQRLHDVRLAIIDDQAVTWQAGVFRCRGSRKQLYFGRHRLPCCGPTTKR
jgi:hypothetical protein